MSLDGCKLTLCKEQDRMTKANYIVISFIAYTSGDMQNNPHNVRTLSFSRRVVNKNLERRSKI